MSKRMVKPMVWAGAAVLGLVMVLGLTAGPVKEAYIPAEIQWGVHWDKEAMDASVLGKRLEEEMNNFGWAGMMASFEQEWGFNPWQTMTGVTLYGNQRDCQSVVIILEGQFDTANITTKLLTKENHGVLTYGEHEIHTWMSHEACGNAGGQMVYGAFVGNDKIVLSAGQAALEKGLDTIDGKAMSLAQTSGVSAIREYSQNALFVAGAERLSGMIPMKGHRGVILSHARDVVMSVTETNGQVSVNFMLMLDTEEAAAQVAQVLEGMQAYALLSAQQKPMLAQLANGMQLTCEGRQLTVTVTAEAEFLVTFMKLHALGAFDMFK